MAVTFKEVLRVGTVKESKRKPMYMTVGHWGNAEDAINIRSYFENDDEEMIAGKGVQLTKEELETVIKLYEENKEAIIKALKGDD